MNELDSSADSSQTEAAVASQRALLLSEIVEQALNEDLSRNILNAAIARHIEQ